MEIYDLKELPGSYIELDEFGRFTLYNPDGSTQQVTRREVEIYGGVLREEKKEEKEEKKEEKKKEKKAPVKKKKGLFSKSRKKK